MAAIEFKSCYAAGCATRIKVGMLMCGKHWDMLAAPLKARVWETYYAWKAGGRARSYLLAALKAKLAVAQLEGVEATLTESLAIGIADMEKLEREKVATL